MSVVSSRPVVTQVTVIFFYLEESSMVGELCNVCVCSHVPIPGTSVCSKKSFLKLSVFFFFTYNRDGKTLSYGIGIKYFA